jgi:hypothetical protein
MVKLLGLCFIVLSARFAWEASAQEKQALRLVQTIPLPEVKGRLDHMGVDLEKNRLFVAAVANNSLAVVDLTGGRVIKSLAGFKDSQDAVPGRRLQQTLCVQPRWACQGFPRRELLAGSGLQGRA